MSMYTEFILAALVLLLYINLMLVFSVLFRKLRKKDRQALQKEADHALFGIATGDTHARHHRLERRSYHRMLQSLELPEAEDRNLQMYFRTDKAIRKHIRMLKSVRRLKRKEAAVFLAHSESNTACFALEKAIAKEKDFPVKLYMANALADIGNPGSIPVLVQTLYGAHRWYRDRVNALICGYGHAFDEYLPQLISRKQIEIQSLILAYAKDQVSGTLRDYLTRLITEELPKLREMEAAMTHGMRPACKNCAYGGTRITGGKLLCPYKVIVHEDDLCHRYKEKSLGFVVTTRKELVYQAAAIISEKYPEFFAEREFLWHEDPVIREHAVMSRIQMRPEQAHKELLGFMQDHLLIEPAAKALTGVYQQNPAICRYLLEQFGAAHHEDIKNVIADVLSVKMDMLLMKLRSPLHQEAYEVLLMCIGRGRTGELIGFINSNKDPDIEEELIRLVREGCNLSVQAHREFCRHLNERVLLRCDLSCVPEEPVRRQELKDSQFIRMVLVLMVAVLLSFPLIYLARHWEDIFYYGFDAMYHVRNYILDYNMLLIAYSATISGVYLLLLLLALKTSGSQEKLWELKRMDMLFKPRMLPSVSIIAPAFNEEKTIIESVNSLMNLRYPDYELIVVNDGSTDETMNLLIRHFELERQDIPQQHVLTTMPVRGIYVNPANTKLRVIDKENGGKADSLNAGINLANCEYYCGIDADSMLEEDALLKLASLTLDAGVEVPALGGNILPVNGSVVDHGEISELRIPRKPIGILQTVEYVRSFMTGRLGWASVNSLMLISGAFGLFRKERVVSVGGYLTAREKFRKDTVGEDMEIVIRIRRFMHEHKMKFVIGFAFNANCWTQVPEDLKSLRSQRQRWGRGLADSITYHRKMIFNPRYGRSGMIGMPYFFIFELIGPIIEVQGYILVILAAILGYLSTQMALMLFMTVIFIGVLVSLSSFLLLEKTDVRFRVRDLMVLLLFAVIENFGPRQMLVIWRVGAIFRLFWRDHSWGRIQRVNYQTRETTEGHRGEV